MTQPREPTVATRGHLFELTGGRLCLDFANTVDNRPLPTRVDHVPDYRALVSWGEQAGALSARAAAELVSRSEREPARAAAVMARATKLREAIYALFSAIARKAEPDAADLAVLNEMLPDALRHLRLDGVGGGFAWSWSDDSALDRMLWPVARSAAELLTSDLRSRVRECAADRCAWLFLDESRNRSRRWCDMTVCGNRSKARRHYQKTKKKA